MKPAELVEQFEPGTLQSSDAAVADVERGQSAEGVGDTGQRIRWVRLQGIAASAEFVLAFEPGGVDAVFDVELADVAPVRRLAIAARLCARERERLWLPDR